PETLQPNVQPLSPQEAGKPLVMSLTRPPVPDDRPTIRGATALAAELAKLPWVEGVAPAAMTAGILGFGTARESATVFGVEPRAEAKVTEFHRLVVRGSWDRLYLTSQGVVLGYKLAERLGADVGDRILLTGEAGAAKDLEVVGILAVGIGGWDEGTAVVPLSVAQGLAGWGSDEASELRLRTPTVELERKRRQVQELSGRRVERWEETNRAALQLFRTIGITTYLLTGFVLLVAGLGIANRLATVILNKERDIAILRAYGFSRAAIRGMFLVQGLLLAIAGAILGSALAFLAISYFQAFPIRFAPREGAALAYTELFLANRPLYYGVVGLLATAIALLSSALSVRRAARVLPVEVLRGRG
ncbi:MAG: ABC transporter permease, partial [Thermoanaerobaculum sp.]|nr:ABC transporter permease [Thermoanaerobaculum sp.]